MTDRRSSTDGKRSALKQETLSFVQRCNQAMEDTIVASEAQESPCSRLLVAYKAWIASQGDAYDVYMLDKYSRKVALEVKQWRISASDVVNALLADSDDDLPLVLAWKLHNNGTINFNNLLTQALCTGYNATIYCDTQKLMRLCKAFLCATKLTLTAHDAHDMVVYVVSSFVTLEETSKATNEFASIREVLKLILTEFSTASEQAQNIIITSFLPYKSNKAIQELIYEKFESLLSASSESTTALMAQTLSCIADMSLFVSIVRDMVRQTQELIVYLERPLCANIMEYYHRQGPQLTMELLSISHDLAYSGLQNMQADTMQNGIELARHICKKQPQVYYRWFEQHFSSNVIEASTAAPIYSEDPLYRDSICLRTDCGLPHTKRCVEFTCAVLSDSLTEVGTIEEIEMTIRVVKSHSSEFPEYVWNYVSLARNSINQLKLATIPPSQKVSDSRSVVDVNQDVKDEIHTYIKGYLDTGRISGKLRQRILMQGNVWQASLKPYLLNGVVGSTEPYAMILGRMQLVHALVHEKAIGEVEYGQFVRKMNSFIQDRVDFERSQKRTLVSLVRELVSLDSLNKGNSDRLISLMQSRVQGQLQSPSHSLDILAQDLQVACLEWLRISQSKHSNEQMFELLKAIKALRYQRVTELTKKLIKWACDQVRSLTCHSGRLLGIMNCVYFETELVAPLEESIDEVNPECISALFGMCAAYIQTVLQLSSPSSSKLISVKVVQFLYWVSLRHHFHGLIGLDSSVIQEMDEKLFDLPQFIGHLESEEFFRVWLHLELHYSESCTSYRVECLTMHFMRIKERADVAAITTICTMGKELLNHQDSCQESLLTQPPRLPASKISIHPCWTPTKKRQRSASTCNLGVGLTLFHQVLPMVMHQSKNKINLVNAIVTILTEHVATRLATAEHRAAYLTLYFELIAVVLPHGPLHAKAHLALQNLAQMHLQPFSPWHPRVTSIMLAASISYSHHSDSPEALELIERHIDPLVVASVVYFWSMISPALVTDTPSLLPPLLEELYRLLIVRRHEPITSSWQTLYLNLLPHWLMWGLKLDISVLECKLNLPSEKDSVLLIDKVTQAWQKWIKTTTSTECLIYPRLLIQIASRAIELHAVACGQSMLQVSTELPVAALWVLLVTHQLSPLIQQQCMRLHKVAWLHHICQAYVTYSAATWTLSPALTQSIPSLLHSTLELAAHLHISINNPSLHDTIQRLVPSNATLPSVNDNVDEIAPTHFSMSPV